MKNKYAFIVKWEKGSMNDNIIKWLKKNNISFCYSHFGELIADMYGIGEFFKFENEHLGNSLYGIKIRHI